MARTKILSIGGGSAFASGGVTNNVVPKSNGAGQLADSSITDNGTNVTTTEAILAPAGTQALPGYAFSGGANQAASGMAYNASGLILGTTNGTTGWATIAVNNGGIQVGASEPIGWSSSSTPFGNTSDTVLTRDGAVGTMALKQSATADALFRLYGANSGFWEHYSATELLTLSTGGTTTNTAANLLPAGSIIHAVCCRITTTITTATNWSVGDSTTAARFSASNATLTSGTTSVGLDHMSGAVTTLAAGPSQAAAATVRITTTGTPGAGVIRITVYASRFVAPTS